MQRTVYQIGSITLATLLIAAFMGTSGLLTGVLMPIILWASAIIFLIPLRQQSPLARRLANWASVLFAVWIVTDLGALLLPFALSFFIAYVVDPVVEGATKWRIPRWLSALIVNGILVGAVVIVAMFVAPVVWSQLQDIVKSISSFVNAAQAFLESRQFYRWLSAMGIPSDQVRVLVQDYLIPRVESISQYLFSLIVSFLEGAAGIVAHLVNIILVPLLTFYLLVDMPRIKELLTTVLEKQAPRILHDLYTISAIIRAYITGQMITATFVGVFATIGFSIVGIPYGVFLGVLCGMLNPIPYVGLLASLLIAIMTIILAKSPQPMLDITLVTIIVNLLHFVAAYIIDPRVTGKRVGLHPVVLIAALFVFGHFFGFLGLIVAVPITAVLMMYFKRWQAALQSVVVEHSAGENAG